MTALSTAGLVVAVMLAGTFAWAGQAKLRHQRVTRKGFAALGLSHAKALATAVPIVELFIAVGLVAVPSVGAAASGVLLVAFTAVLVYARRSAVGEIRCGCFGAADSEPVTWVTFVRNVGLLVAVLFVGIARPPSVFKIALAQFVAIVTSAVVAALIGSVTLALLSMRRQLGVFFSQSPGNAVRPTI